MPAGAERFLDARTLADSHRHLATLLRPGMTVLDVGCGTGAMTEGIAQVVGPQGHVWGIDVSEELIARARSRERRQSNLSFEVADVALLGRAERSFDVVTSARMLQWLADPRAALLAMVGVLRRGGLLVALDYNHHKASWAPPLPASVQAFYRAFLEWRARAGMDNEIAERLPAMFDDLGLTDVRCVQQPETTSRGDRDFEHRIGLWGEVIATRGHQLVADGFLTETERTRAAHEFRQWAGSEAQTQSLWLATTQGTAG
jgi:ubiquinone/menaquinone biosynthesis C-methylase UbiE